MKKNLFLLFCTFFLIILLSELFIRFFFPQDLQRFWATNEKEYGLMLNKKNYIHKLTRFKSFKAKYTFGEYHNRVTLKNPDPLKKKILILGESFTLGWLIDDQNTFVHKLQMDNLDYNFINVAVGGWGSENYTLFTEMFCTDIKPNKIFVFLNTDDFNRGFESGFYQEKNNNLVKNKVNFKDNQKPSNFDKKIPLYKFLKSHSHLFMLTRNVVHNLFKKPKFNPWSSDRYWPRPIKSFNVEYSNKVLEFNKKVFLHLKSISTDCNASLHIFNLMWADHSMMLDTNPNKLFLQSANSFFAKNDIDYYEDNSKMKDLYENPMKYIIDTDFHPNYLGTELIYNNLKNNVKKVLSD